MSEFHFPVPKSVINNIIDEQRQKKEPLSLMYAQLDFMVLSDSGRRWTERELAERWDWHRSKVRRNKEGIVKFCESCRKFGKLGRPKIDPRSTQDRPKIDPEISLNGAESDNCDPKPTQNRPKIDPRSTQNHLYSSRVPNSNPNPNEKEKQKTMVDPGTDLTDVPSKHQTDWKPRYAEVMRSWNEFADRNGLPRIVKMSDNRRQWVRSRYNDIWPDIAEIYRNLEHSDFHMGKSPGYRGITFETLWARRENYLKYLEMTPKENAPGRYRVLEEKSVGYSREADMAHSNGTSGNHRRQNGYRY